MVNRPYAGEDILSLERMKRAVTRRVMDEAGISLEQGTPLGRGSLAELAAREWAEAKEAVKASPAARQKALQYMRRIISDLTDEKMKADRSELESLGVEERP